MKKLQISWRLICRHGLVLLAAVVVAVLGCPIYEFLGINCPLCGTTRAWVSFLAGEISTAFRYHPFFLITPFWFFTVVHYNSIFKKNKVIGSILICFAFVLMVFNLLRVTGMVAQFV